LRNNNELGRLLRGKLEAELFNFERNAKLGKKVTLELAENDGAEGIKLTYLPVDAGWNSAEIVEIKISGRVYNTIKDTGKFGTRYNGDDIIEIFNGDPRASS
jgi:hypothetical protein